MATNEPPRPPVSTATRAKNFLAYGFAISLVLHAIVGPFLKFQQTHTEEEQPQKVTVVRVPTPPPTPPPTPKPTPTPTPPPTPKPTPPPTPPPKVVVHTPAPVQPKLKINTAKTSAKTNTGPTEETNKYTQGTTQGIPQGIGTSKPIPSAPPATPAATPAPTATPLACARPNVPATTIHASEPDMPAMAQQQGITGTVQVVVSLDTTSHVTNAKVQSSPSALLNNAALQAARNSTFQTEIRNCKPIAADYIFSVEFASQ
jgi:TonB family protein